MRAALGASPRRLVRQLLTESVCLAIVSGVCGLLVSILGVQVLRAALPPTLPRIDEVHVDAFVLGFGLLVSVVCGLFFGVIPAVRATHVDLLPALAQSGKSVFGPSRGALRQGLVVSQMGLATMLLVVAALLTQSFLRLQNVPLGFEPEDVMTARISLPETKYSEELRISNFYRELLQLLDGRADVQAVGVGTSAPFAPGVRATADVSRRHARLRRCWCARRRSRSGAPGCGLFRCDPIAPAIDDRARAR
jgi:putative ABC transport system permease protein